MAQSEGISPRAAQLALAGALKGKPWRGHHLEVTERQGKRGGRAGTSLFVRRESLPEDVQRRLDGLSGGEAKKPSPVRPNKSGPQPTPATQLYIVQWVRSSPTPEEFERRRKLVPQMFVHPEGTPRAGKPVSAASFDRWNAKFDSEGVAGLLRKTRADAGVQRVIVSRRVDAEWKRLGGSLDKLREALDAALHTTGSVIAKRPKATLYRAGHHAADHQIAAALRDLGCTLPDEELIEFCRVPMRVLRPLRKYKALATYKHDKGQSNAVQEYRVSLTTKGLRPMQRVSFDVKIVDVLVQREKGKPRTVFAIVGYDWATKRFFVRFHLLPGREAITQGLVAGFLAEMFADPSWGVFQEATYDNGAEFAILPLAKQIATIAAQIQGNHPEERWGRIEPTLPYQGQSKSQESHHARWDRVIVWQHEGHIGGDRMKKPTENLGKTPQPHPDTWDEVHAELKRGVEMLNATPFVTGENAGLSPNDLFNAAVDEGWTSTIAPREVSEFVFCKSEDRVVVRGRVQWGGSETYWHHDALLVLPPGERIEVRHPIFGDRKKLSAWSKDGRFLGWLERCPKFPATSMAGAHERARKAKVQAQYMRELAAEVDPNVDPFSEASKRLSYAAPVRVPKVGATISLGPEYERAAAEAAELPEDRLRLPSEKQKRQEARNRPWLQYAENMERRRTGTDR